MDAKPIIAGTDGSQESLRAVAWAAREAALHGARLRIVSVPAQGSWLALDMVGPEAVSRSAHQAARRALDAALADWQNDDSGVDSVTYAVLSHAHGPVASVPDPR